MLHKLYCVTGGNTVSCHVVPHFPLQNLTNTVPALAPSLDQFIPLVLPCSLNVYPSSSLFLNCTEIRV